MEKMATYLFLTLTDTGERMAPWVIKSTENLPTLTSTRTLDHTTNPSTHKPFHSTLVHTIRALCDTENLHDELELLKTTFRENGYSIKHIWWVLNPAVRTSKPKDKFTSVAFLPYIQTTYGQLSRMLAKHNIKCDGLPPRNISSFLRPVKTWD
jgi:hypothetical protein